MWKSEKIIIAVIPLKIFCPVSRSGWVLLDVIYSYRSKNPDIGGLKLYHKLCSLYGSEITGGFPSSDAFGTILCPPPKKPRRTTDSNHFYKKYPNLIKGVTARHTGHSSYTCEYDRRLHSDGQCGSREDEWHPENGVDIRHVAIQG